MNKKYWIALCFECGWFGKSTKLYGGGPLGESGDYDDLYCPSCDSSEIEDIKIFFELTFTQKIKLILRKITFHGLRRKIKNTKELNAYIEEQVKLLDYKKKEKQMNKYCVWKLHKHSYKYYSGCGGIETFDKTVVFDIKFKYCPYCGKEIKINE